VSDAEDCAARHDPKTPYTAHRGHGINASILTPHQEKDGASLLAQQAQFQKPAQLVLSGLLGIASVLLVSSVTMASPNTTASNPDERSWEQVRRKAPPGMVWIPGGTFLILMGTNDKDSFPNERPAHLVQVQGFGWMSTM